MTIRSILAVAEGVTADQPLLAAAMALAKRHGAYLRCLHISLDPIAYIGLMGEGMIMSAELFAAIEESNAKMLKHARGYFHKAAEEAGVVVQNEDFAPNMDEVSACFVQRSGQGDDVMMAEGRLSDIILMHPPRRGHSTVAYEGAMDAALFHTARPLLLVPGKKNNLLGDGPIVVGWNGAREAAAALKAALPLIGPDVKVHVCTVQEHGQRLDFTTESRVLSYLRLHGIAAEHDFVPRGNRSVGEALLEHAKTLHPSLLVMGAYGHSRFREMILGGATHHMLQQTSLPLLLAH